MPLKIFSAVVAFALLLSFLLPMALKLKEASLAVVMGIGLAMMLVDAWQSLREKDE